MIQIGFITKANLYQILQICFSECAHLVLMSIKRLRNISTIDWTFMNHIFKF